MVHLHSGIKATPMLWETMFRTVFILLTSQMMVGWRSCPETM